jgi:hypothetical protein
MTLPSSSHTSHPGGTPSSDTGWMVLLGGCTGLILAVLAGATAGVILNLRETALRAAETTQRHLSLVLAEQADRSLQVLDVVLGGIVLILPAQGIVDADSLVREAAKETVHTRLRSRYPACRR